MNFVKILTEYVLGSCLSYVISLESDAWVENCVKWRGRCLYFCSGSKPVDPQQVFVLQREYLEEITSKKYRVYIV